MKTYCDTNFNYCIKIKLTDEGRIIYKKHYAKHNCEAPKLNIDDEGYVQFQIYDFMKIFGERLFMGATLPCETNCKIQVEDGGHYVKDELSAKEDEIMYPEECERRNEMEEYLYSIKDETGNIIAQHMRLDIALTLVDALFNKYYNEPKIGYTIVRETETKEEVK